MSRKAIIDFLLEQREYLLDNNLIYATICFFEKNYQTSILELDKKIDDAYIYHMYQTVICLMWLKGYLENSKLSICGTFDNSTSNFR